MMVQYAYPDSIPAPGQQVVTGIAWIMIKGTVRPDGLANIDPFNARVSRDADIMHGPVHHRSAGAKYQGYDNAYKGQISRTFGHFFQVRFSTLLHLQFRVLLPKGILRREKIKLKNKVRISYLVL